MKKMYFRYGNGKSADLCQTAYNYREGDANVVVLNALNNQKITSKVEYDGKYLLSVDPTDSINDYLFLQGFRFYNENVDAILVDNAHLLSVNQVEQLYYLCKTFDITVITYGIRLNEFDKIPDSSLRLMELSNELEAVDMNKSNLVFYYGTMNSSKTAKLLYKAYDLEARGYKVITIKPAVDRDENLIQSRIGLQRKASIVLKNDDSLLNYDFSNIDYILVDEAQFLSINQINELKLINEKYSIPVLCYGLKSDFLTKAFPGSSRLLAIAELKKMRTICKCQDKIGASFNARKYLNGEFITDGPQVAIDDGKQIIYESLCDKCYIEKVEKINLNNPEKVLKKIIKKNV